MNREYPNLLVIGNNSLSENNSNGRTLAGFLRGWDKEKIAQLYISGELPESKVCNKFFQITDKAVIKGILNKNIIGRAVENTKSETVSPQYSGYKKTILKLMARDFLWGTNVWWNKRVKNWLSDFSPEVILFFAGESVFTLRMAMKISKYCKAPIVVYNSEAYYFKEKNYLKNGDKLSEIIYPLFHKSFQNKFKKLMKQSEYTIYINDKLKRDYDLEFNVPSEAIYTATEIEPIVEKKKNETSIISYLGNLGVGRHKALIEIAEALQEINPEYKLNIYGKIPNDEVKSAFDRCSSINYQGVISYEKVIDVMCKSDLLVHGESFDDFTRWDLKYAFTTKIADSLACGTSFLLYAPSEIACTEYISENECAFVVADREKLKNTLERALFDDKLRHKYITNAVKIAKMNHNSAINCERFQSILAEVALKGL